MRIDFIGNANSYPLSILRGMRDLGIDAHLHLLDDYYLNAPENRFAEYLKGYPQWIHDWRPCNIPFYFDLEKISAIQKELDKADALVLNLGGLFFGTHSNKPYFCLLTGTDLLTYATSDILQANSYFTGIDYPTELSTCLHLEVLLNSVDFFRNCIREANGYSYFPRALQPQAQKILESIGALEDRQYPLLVTDVDEIAYIPPRERSEQSPLRVILAARCTWDKKASPQLSQQDDKGTDVFLHGAALAIHQGIPLDIHMFRKGTHLEQTEELTHILGLTPHITWHAEATQQDFFKHLEQCDVVVDSVGTSHIGMAATDSMALGKPVIANRPDHQLWGIPQPFPILHALSPQEVSNNLIRLHSDATLYMRIAKDSRNFAEKYLHRDYSINKILSALQRPKPNHTHKTSPTIDARWNLQQYYAKAFSKNKEQIKILNHIEDILNFKPADMMYMDKNKTVVRLMSWFLHKYLHYIKKKRM